MRSRSRAEPAVYIVGPGFTFCLHKRGFLSGPVRNSSLFLDIGEICSSNVHLSISRRDTDGPLIAETQSGRRKVLPVITVNSTDEE